MTLPSWLRPWTRTHSYTLAAALLSFTLSLIASLFFFKTKIHPTNPQARASASTITLPSQKPTLPPPEDISTLGIVLLGYGGAGHQGGFLTDVILFMHLDFDTSTLSLISLPRDLWYTFPDGVPRKLNTAFTLNSPAAAYPNQDIDSSKAHSGAESVKQAVATITGLNTDYFAAIDFLGFKLAIEELGGIDVNVESTLDDSWYPIRGRELELCDHTPQEVTDLSNTLSGFELEKQFPCRYEHLHFDPGIATMDGDTALKFSRSRHGSSDFDRSRRQQALILAIADKLFSLNALNNIPDFFSNLTHSIHSDIDVKTLTTLSPLLINLLDFRLVRINLSIQNVLQTSKSSAGAFILVPKDNPNSWDSIHSFIHQQLRP